MAPIAEQLYVRVLRPILFQLDPESAHRLTLALLAGLPPAVCARDRSELSITLWRMEFRNPIGLAAGMDKDVRAAGAWQSMGFGFAEFGTITPRPQSGNAPPRMWRIPDHQALVNRLGFPSAGMERAARRLARLRRSRLTLRVGVNLGPNRDTPRERITEDYAALGRALGALADFVVVNLSSPNTPGLRDWQAPERVREIVNAIRASRAELTRPPPLLIKVAPDLDAAATAQICDEALALGIDGIVATNTTIAHESVTAAYGLEGGLSGRPLQERARAVICGIYRHTRGRLPIIGVGGVASAEDAYGHIKAGASAVEVYSGLVYRGPSMIGTIKTGLSRMLQSDRLGSITEAVGRDA